MFYHTVSQKEYSDIRSFKLDNPNTSFGELDTEEERNATDLFSINETAPSVNTIYSYVVPNGVEFNGTEYVRKWVIENYPTVEVKQRLLKAITEKRKQVETGGVTFPNGMTVSTGIDDQNRITSVIANADLSGVTSVDFKAESGWITLSLEQVKGIAIAIALHVQACFTAERNHHQNVDALTDEELASYDITSGWPNQ